MARTRLNDLETSGELLVDLGPLPVAHAFLLPGTTLEAPTCPLSLRIDPDTGLVHQGRPFSAELLKPRFDWLARFEPEDHLDQLAETLVGLPEITQDSVFAGVTFKDDSTLRRLKRLGYPHHWRLDPVADLGVADPCASVETYQAALTLARTSAIRGQRGPADVLVVRHLLEHAHDLPEFVAALRHLLRPGGYLVWEVPDCTRSFAAGDCTIVWEEHTYYFTEFTLHQTLRQLGLAIVYAESMPYPLENSLVVITQEAAVSQPPVQPDPQEVAREIVRANGFAQAIDQRRTSVRRTLEALRREHGPIALFGAGHLAVAFLSILQVADLITLVIDDDPHKKGLRLPVAQLPIVGSEALYSGAVKVCLLGLNPQNQPNVIANHERFLQQGGVFASIFPGTDGYLEDVK